MNSYTQFNLKSNPFRLTPALSSDELICALLVDEKAAAGDAYGNLLVELLLLPDPIGLDRLQLWVGEQKTGQIVFCVNLAREAFKSLLMPMKRRSAFQIPRRLRQRHRPAGYSRGWYHLNENIERPSCRQSRAD